MNRWLVLTLCCCLWMLGIPVWGQPLLGRADGSAWQRATAAERLSYCEKAFLAFRSSPSQSYITSAHVQALNPEAFCQRLDQFYSYELNQDTTLDEAAALAPLLFADLPLSDLKADIRHDRNHY
ncbi:MAG: hypothetical protein Q6K99_05740 [Thermostichales cyanobacterium BF4_bins_65]